MSKLYFLDLLTILFIGLKLSGHINWSWWWVLAPFWGQWVLIIILCIIAGILCILTDTNFENI